MDLVNFVSKSTLNNLTFICQKFKEQASNLFGKLDGLDLNESSSHCLHIRLGIAESDTAASNGVPE